MNLLKAIEESYKKKETAPAFAPGDTVRVMTRVQEGDKERFQPFEGVVVARKGGSTHETFMVRKISFGVGVEKIFPLHSPFIEKIEVTRRGSVSRAKLYYLRDKKGKAAKVKERERFLDNPKAEAASQAK